MMLKSLVSASHTIVDVLLQLFSITSFLVRKSAKILGLVICIVLASSNTSNHKNAHAAGADIQQIPIRGIVRASEKADISTELVARVTKIAFKEGEAFNKGQLLMQLDCRRQLAEHAVAKANQREISVGLKSALFLNKRKAASRNEVEIARARSDAATSKANAIGYKLEACTIHAPYAGRVSKLNINKHEMTRTSNPLLSIVALENPQIELIVPSDWLTWLTRGAQFEFRVDETGRTYPANVLRIGATVIAVNQTIQVFARFAEPAFDILPGMSGTAKFPVIGQ